MLDNNEKFLNTILKNNSFFANKEFMWLNPTNNFYYIKKIPLKVNKDKKIIYLKYNDSYLSVINELINFIKKGSYIDDAWLKNENSLLKYIENKGTGWPDFELNFKDKNNTKFAIEIKNFSYLKDLYKFQNKKEIKDFFNKKSEIYNLKERVNKLIEKSETQIKKPIHEESLKKYNFSILVIYFDENQMKNTNPLIHELDKDFWIRFNSEIFHNYLEQNIEVLCNSISSEKKGHPIYQIILFAVRPKLNRASYQPLFKKEIL